MHQPALLGLLFGCLGPLLVAAVPAQSAGEPPPAPQTAQGMHHIRVEYPRDRDLVIADVDDAPIRLFELVEHIDRRHYPGFAQFMAGPEGKGSAEARRMLQSDLLAPWVRNYAFVRALRVAAEERGPIDQERLEAAIAAALKEAFEPYLQQYIEGLRQRALPTDFGQDRVDRLLADYQLRYGLAAELQGWLDYLEPVEDWDRQALSDFYQDHARVFGGGVTIAHILVQHRDAGTGLLLTDANRNKAAVRLAEIQQRLERGEDFATVARLFSEDTATARDGGELRGVQRFDHRLPPEICRAAWHMNDGEVSEPIETQYGWHIVERIEHVQQRFMLFTDAVLPTVRETRQRHEQEQLLFEVRERYGVRLHL